jgi:hypothetical protein
LGAAATEDIVRTIVRIDMRGVSLASRGMNCEGTIDYEAAVSFEGTVSCKGTA